MRRLLSILSSLALPAALAACASLPDLERLEQPRYQTGKFQGAAVCAECHPDTHEQWSKSSRHAVATKSPGFRHALAEIRENPALGVIISEAMCYSCHGDKTLNEGVNCESCHGPPLPGVDIMVTHEKQFKPRLKKMRKGNFCATCHEVDLPFTGVHLTTLHSEWKASPAGRKGETCQVCHMEKAKGEDDYFAYHGFRTAVRNPGLYKGKLRLQHVAVNDKRLRVTVKNRVTGHSIPAAGPTRVLALELTLRDRAGHVVHRDTKRFFKHFSMLPVVGGVPFMLIDNSQLRAGEARQVRFMLPTGVRAAATRARLVLRMYEVADKYEGDIARAHWQSKPIAVRTIKLGGQG